MNKTDYASYYTLDKGLLLVVSGPSGAGKSALCREYVQSHPDTVLSVSETTRAPRAGERDGVEYTFITEDVFETRRQQDYYLECAGIYNKHYGTPHRKIEALLERGQNVILEIDPQGAAQVREKIPEAVTVFVLPPSFEQLEHQIRGRQTETEAQICLRLSSAQKEIERAEHYDFIIINQKGRLDCAVSALDAIVRAEHCSAPRILSQYQGEDTGEKHETEN